MKKKIYSTKEKRKIGVIYFCSVKALLLFAVFFAIFGTAQAQSNDHDDSMIVLNRNDFSLNIKSSNLNLLQVENRKTEFMKPGMMSKPSNFSHRHDTNMSN